MDMHLRKKEIKKKNYGEASGAGSRTENERFLS